MLAAACQSSEPADEGTTSDDGGDRDSTAAPSSTTFATPDACMNSQDCETGGLCVAPFDPGGDDSRGAAACVGNCIEENDLQSWCIDDSSCCDNLACNRVDGFCEPRGLAGSTSSTGAGLGTSGSGTAGDTTAGDTTAGDTTAGDTTAGNTTTGGTTAADPTAGDTTAATSTSAATSTTAGQSATTTAGTAGASGTGSTAGASSTAG